MSKAKIKLPSHARAQHAIAGRAGPSHAKPHHILLIIRKAALAAYRNGGSK